MWNRPIRRGPSPVAPVTPIAALVILGALVSACADQPGGPLGPSLSGVPSPPGHDVAAAVRAQNRITPGLMKMAGVVGTATGLDADGVPVIRVFTAERGVPGIPVHADGIPIEVEFTGLIMADSDPTQRVRPAPVGFSVGHPSITAGTIGARVVDGSGNTYILSNNHVLAAANNASVGDPILQPGPFDGGTAADQIGTLSDFEPIAFNLGAPNLLDAAIAAVSASDVGTSTPADGYGTPSSTAYDLDSDGNGAVDGGVLGLGIQKFGRTTQLTQGTLTEINVTVDVCYESLFGIICLNTARFVDQLAFTDISEGGDSGSLIVTADGSNQPVALLYAGSPTRTLGNRIDLVLNRFGVTVDGDGSPPPPPPPPVDDPPTASFTYSCTLLVCDFDATNSTDDNGIVAYAWDFGDGGSGSGVTAQHTYASAGTSTVVLTVTDTGSQDGTTQQDVTTSSTPPVDNPPTAAFTFGCSDLTCNFDASGSTDDNGIATYAWDFGDGGSGSGVAPQHTYGSEGTRTVILTVTDTGGQPDTHQESVTTTAPPPPPASPTLTAEKKKARRGMHQIDLTWANVPWSNIVVFRMTNDNYPPEIVTSFPGTASGTYSDLPGNKGKRFTYTHFICAGTGALDPCTAWVTTSY